ncbi:hypothetical protein IWX49DRAFT_199198 [Phyllosticta citricarpa]|uniref:Uncharacterized protein n=1 Tax=Phyllosticta paracitricarpa TaxID=2016321 RepID=A0ABR1N006_9PEZI
MRAPPRIQTIRKLEQRVLAYIITWMLYMTTVSAHCTRLRIDSLLGLLATGYIEAVRTTMKTTTTYIQDFLANVVPCATMSLIVPGKLIFPISHFMGHTVSYQASICNGITLPVTRKPFGGGSSSDSEENKTCR